MGLLTVIGGIIVSILLVIGVIRAVDHISNNNNTTPKKRK